MNHDPDLLRRQLPAVFGSLYRAAVAAVRSAEKCGSLSIEQQRLRQEAQAASQFIDASREAFVSMTEPAPTTTEPPPLSPEGKRFAQLAARDATLAARPTHVSIDGLRLTREEYGSFRCMIELAKEATRNRVWTLGPLTRELALAAIDKLLAHVNDPAFD